MLTIEQERNMYANFYHMIAIKAGLCASLAKLNMLSAEEQGKDISDYDRGKFDAFLELFEETEKYQEKEKQLRENN